MADTVVSKTLHEDSRHLIVNITNESDGTGEAAVTKVDVSALSGAPDEVAIRRIHGFTYGMAVKLLWDATTDTLAVPLPADAQVDITFDPPLRNTSGAGKTGDLKLTTIGHTAGDAYSLVLDLLKVG